MIPELTYGLGVSVGELATDDDLVRPCPVEVAAGLVELAEEVADVVLGTLVQDPEVGGSSMAAYLQRRTDGQKRIRKCNIDREEDDVLPQTGTERQRSVGGALADAVVVGHLF